MNVIRLDTNHLLPNTAVWATPQERTRWTEAVKKWQKENPKAKIEHQALFESWFYLHVLEQRLRDNRTFYDGTPTSIVGDGYNKGMSEDDLARKKEEQDRYLPVILKNKLEYLKTALASNISLAVTGDAKSITELIRAARNQEGSINE